MKKSLLVIGLILAIASLTYAGQELTAVNQDVTVTIFCHYHVAMEVSPTSFSWGSETSPLNTNENYVSGTSITVRNISPVDAASIMKVQLARTGGTIDWAWGNSLGDRGIEKAVLLGVFAPAQPAFAEYATNDILPTTAADWTWGAAFDPTTEGVRYGQILPKETGSRWLVSINAGGAGNAPGHARGLWLALQTPTASRYLTSGGKTIVVTITGAVLSQ